MKEAPIPPGFHLPFYLDMKDCLPPTEIPKGDKTATIGWIEGEGAATFRRKTQLLAACVEVGEVNKTFAGVDAVSPAVGHDGTLIHKILRLARCDMCMCGYWVWSVFRVSRCVCVCVCVYVCLCVCVCV